MNFVFTKIPISEYQSLTPSPGVVYIVEYEPGLYDENMTFLESWDDLKQSIAGKHLTPVIEVNEDGYMYLYDDSAKMYLSGVLWLSDEVKDIGDFSYISGLKGLVMRDSVTDNHSGDFNHSGLEIVRLSNSLQEVSSYCFSDNHSLNKVVFGNNITKIGLHAFYNCLALEYIELPSSLQRIGTEAFYGCINLKSITIPANVYRLDPHPFPVDPVYIDGKLVSDGMDSITFENTTGWYAAEYQDGQGFVKNLDVSDSYANPGLFRDNSHYYWFRR